MINAKSFVNSAKFRDRVTDWYCYSCLFHCCLIDVFVWFRNQHQEDTPLIVQFAGDDANTIIEAAKYVQDHVTAGMVRVTSLLLSQTPHA